MVVSSLLVVGFPVLAILLSDIICPTFSARHGGKAPAGFWGRMTSNTFTMVYGHVCIVLLTLVVVWLSTDTINDCETPSEKDFTVTWFNSFFGPSARKLVLCYVKKQSMLKWSFPCMYTSLSAYSCVFSLLYWYSRYKHWWIERLTKAGLLLFIFSSVSPIVSNLATHFHDNVDDVWTHIFLNWALGAGVAVIIVPFRPCANKHEVEEKPPVHKKPRVGICSSAVSANVNGFVHQFGDRFADEIKEAEFIRLPYSRLDDYEVEAKLNKFKVLILCHSIDNRRLSLTNVTDALYDKFIPRASKIVGKNALIVIAHDFTWSRDNYDKSRSAQEETLRLKQPDVYKYADTIILGGKLAVETDVDVALTNGDWETMKTVLCTV